MKSKGVPATFKRLEVRSQSEPAAGASGVGAERTSHRGEDQEGG